MMNVSTNWGDDSLNNSFINALFNGQETTPPDFNASFDLSETNTTNVGFMAYLTVLDHINVICYLIICILGLVGNCLVIYVVLVYAKMKTVTNMYILNLAISDVLFLALLPVTVTTVIVKHWIFGEAMCRIYFALSAINTFGSSFNLCVMSADRYLAICHPIKSIKYRTTRLAFFMCMLVWVLCALVMLPIILYTRTVKHRLFKGKFSCKLDWPAGHSIHPGKAFVWYSFIVGFVIPVFLITIFYVSVIISLRRVAAAKKSSGSRRSHGRVTRLIFTVVAVYVSCWLPYWCFQVDGTVSTAPIKSFTHIILINAFTIISLANSMLNPLLYAFLCENFRQSFLKAFKCFRSFTKTQSACNEKSNCISNNQTYMRTGISTAVEERMELTVMEDNSVAPPPEPVDTCAQDGQDDSDALHRPTKL